MIPSDIYDVSRNSAIPQILFFLKYLSIMWHQELWDRWLHLKGMWRTLLYREMQCLQRHNLQRQSSTTNVFRLFLCGWGGKSSVYVNFEGWKYPFSALAFFQTSCRVSDWDTIRLIGKSPFMVKYGEKTTDGFLFPCLKGEAQLLQSGIPNLSNIPLLILRFVSCAF